MLESRLRSFQQRYRLTELLDPRRARLEYAGGAEGDCLWTGKTARARQLELLRDQLDRVALLLGSDRQRERRAPRGHGGTDAERSGGPPARPQVFDSTDAVMAGAGGPGPSPGADPRGPPGAGN